MYIKFGTNAIGVLALQGNRIKNSAYAKKRLNLSSVKKIAHSYEKRNLHLFFRDPGSSSGGSLFTFTLGYIDDFSVNLPDRRNGLSGYALVYQRAGKGICRIAAVTQWRTLRRYI
jgi:hypothetical protein